MLLAIVIFSAATRPGWLPEPVAAVAAAGLLILVGVLAPAQARAAAARLAPALGFLAAILVLGMLCERAGLFTAAGARLATASHGSPLRLRWQGNVGAASYYRTHGRNILVKRYR